jgi:hypothetical protein
MAGNKTEVLMKGRQVWWVKGDAFTSAFFHPFIYQRLREERNGVGETKSGSETMRDH